MLAQYVLRLSVCRVVWCCFIMLPRAYRGLGSLVFCYSISSVVVVPASRKTPTSSSSYLYCMLVIIVWYVSDCHIRVLLRMCNAYAETGMFVLIYHICSWYLTAIDLPVWPMYDLLHVLHFNLYIPLKSVLFCVDLSHSWLYMVLHVWNAMFRSVRLNRLITLCVSGLWYINVIHFFLCVCVGFFAFGVLIILFFKL
jgi:hypothetical protein